MSKKKNYPKTEVRESEIHGKGLFAAEEIKAGQLIGKIKGKKTSEDGPHVLWMYDNGRYSEGIQVDCSLKYINHSKSPNVSYYEDRTVVALTNISVNQELTHDYGLEWN